MPGSSTAETLIETYWDVIALDYAGDLPQPRHPPGRERPVAGAQAHRRRAAVHRRDPTERPGSPAPAPTEKQAAYAKVRSVSSMTQDLQTLERQLWSSMPPSVKSMLDFSARGGARGPESGHEPLAPACSRSTPTATSTP